MSEHVSVRRTNTLIREGIGGVGSAQQFSSVKSSYMVRKFKVKGELVNDRRIVKLEDDSFCKYMVNDHMQWISLGSNWYQITRANSGKCTSCGLHTILESNQSVYALVYEPLSVNCNNACVTGVNSSSIEYDFNVSVKCMQSSNSGCGVIFGFKNVSNYCVLVCDVDNKQWELGVVKDDSYLIIKESSDTAIKENSFQNIFIQVRNDTVSVDVNDKIVFTNTKMHHTSMVDIVYLNGLVGIILQVRHCVNYVLHCLY